MDPLGRFLLINAARQTVVDMVVVAIVLKATTGGEKANFQTECWPPVVALTNCLEP